MQLLLWLGAVSLAVIGVALVFAGVTMPALFLPGVVVIDLGVLGAAVAGVLEVRAAA